MQYFAGIDGGQSSTTAVIGDTDGRVLGRGHAGACDELGEAPGSLRLREALEGALSDALQAAHLPGTTHLRAVVVGISGYHGELSGEAPRLAADRVELLHDAPIAHAGAMGGGSGVVVVAGTGSVAYALDDRRAVKTIGGLGYVFGDEGSGFAIARDALAASLRWPHANCAVASAAQNYFAESNADAILKSFYRGAITRDRIAAFARIIIEMFAAKNDPCADDAVVRAQFDLARLACDACCRPELRWEEPARLAFVGGLMSDSLFREGVYAEPLLAEHPVRVIEPQYDAPTGALLLAYRSSGIVVGEVRPA